MKTFWDKGPSKPIRTLLFASVACGIPALIVGPFLSMAMGASNDKMERRFDSICLSRLGTIGKAMSMYAADHDQKFPHANAWVDGTWHYVLKRDPKETTEHVYQCPTIAKMRTGEFGYSMNDKYDRGSPDESGDESVAEPLVFDSDELGRNSHATIGSVTLPPRHGENTFNNALWPNLTAKPIPK